MIKILLLALCLMSAGVFAAHGAIVVVAPTASASGSFYVTEDVTFQITIASENRSIGFHFDEWVTSDGNQTFAAFAPDLALSINGISTTYAGDFADNLTFKVNEVSANDGYFITRSPISLAVGDILTVKAGSYTLQPTPNFNPQATQTFVGEFFVANENGIKLADSVIVPEPSSMLLVVVGLLLMHRRHRRQRTAREFSEG